MLLCTIAAFIRVQTMVYLAINMQHCNMEACPCHIMLCNSYGSNHADYRPLAQLKCVWSVWLATTTPMCMSDLDHYEITPETACTVTVDSARRLMAGCALAIGDCHR